VDELEKNTEGRLIVIRLNIQEEIGMELAPVYGFEFTPTFIYFDAEGGELWRMVGEFNPQQVYDTLE
jgi:thioredoxin-related protein